MDTYSAHMAWSGDDETFTLKEFTRTLQDMPPTWDPSAPLVMPGWVFRFLEAQGLPVPESWIKPKRIGE